MNTLEFLDLNKNQIIEAEELEKIAPHLKEKIYRQFKKNVADLQIQALNYTGAAEYAEKTGNALVEAFKKYLNPEEIPDIIIPDSVAQSVIRPLLVEDYKLVSAASESAQAAINKNILHNGLRPIHAPINEWRVNDIIYQLTGDVFSKTAWALVEPVVMFSIATADSTLKENLKFQSKAGLKPKIIRKAERRCCKWCSSLAGVYNYPEDTPDEIFHRHKFCRCTVDYYSPSESDKKQDVWTREWHD